MNRSYYDDNFGHWDDMHDEDAIAYYNYVQEVSVEKECEGCHRTVKLQPHYGYCDACARMRESGIDF